LVVVVDQPSTLHLDQQHFDAVELDRTVA